MPTKNLTYLYGKPNITADLRTQNADFQVQEVLSFEPTGAGEHHLVHIEKSGLNTIQVAKILASFAKVQQKEVTYAGQKDKNAITQQWFGIRIPGKETPHWDALNSKELTILSSTRHSKKLRIGALSGNKFQIILRNVSNLEGLIERIELINKGVPNYFGEQRFGHDGRNLDHARQMFAGKKVKDRNKRSIYLSAIRSNIFNQLTSNRLAHHGTDPIDGDCVVLAGSKSFFVAEQWDDVLLARLTEKDILLSSPLWGRGKLKSTGQAFDMEMEAAAEMKHDCHGLEQAGLEQERRALLLFPQDLSHEVMDDATIKLNFSLLSGCFATAILRELAQFQDVQEQLFKQRIAGSEL